MRSIIFTNVSALMLASAATGQTAPAGCFARSFDAAHLAAHPDQVVTDIRVNFVEEYGGNISFHVLARMADQGHAGQAGLGGRTLSEAGACWLDSRCQVDCDGGGFVISRRHGDSIDITTAGMRLASDGCADEGDLSDIAERPGQSTTYRLFRADVAICGAN